MFDEAKRCGAHAVKIQKRDNRSLYTEEAFNKPYDNENSFGPTYGLHREFLEFDRDQYEELRDYSREIGICFFATAFDHPSAELLAGLDMPAYKIASADLSNLPLLREVAEIGKPMIMSTGGATMEDVRRAVETVSPINEDFALLQCTAEYPARWDELDLKVITSYREAFRDTVVGLSSHDNGIAMAVASYVLGARIVEKHFTLDRAMKGTDHRFSLEPQGLRKLVRDLKRTRMALGDGIKKMYPAEVDPMKKMGKMLVATGDLPAGHCLREEDISAKSPGEGIPPYDFDRLLGRSLRHPVDRDTPFTWELLEEEAVPARVGAVAAAGGE
jgi:N-acetylneuraminate synthase/sialic acid synthase